MNTNTNTAPATEEMKVLGALLAAMHDNRLDGKKMREAMLWCLNSTAAQPPVPVAWRYQTPTGWHATTDAAAAMRIRAHCPIEPLYVFAAAPKATKAEPVQPETATLPGPSDYQGRSRAAYLSGYEDALSDAGVSVLPVGALAAPTTQAPRSKEAEWIAASSELNCPACGGSGHIEDVKPVEPAVSQGEPQFDLSTSKGGRGYVAWFFGNRLLPRPRHDFDDYCKNVLAADFACVLARHLAAQPQEAAPSQDAEQGNVAALRSALGAMMTQFGMDEDEFSKPTFDQARRALAMEAPANTDVMDAAFEAVRRVFCRLPRHSFIIGPGGGVRKVQDSCGLWVDFDSVHALFDPVAVDAARTQAKESGL